MSKLKKTLTVNPIIIKEFFNPKTTPDFTEETTILRYDTWYLFGVDYMSNEKIRNYFHINPHFRI